MVHKGGRRRSRRPPLWGAAEGRTPFFIKKLSKSPLWDVVLGPGTSRRGLFDNFSMTFRKRPKYLPGGLPEDFLFSRETHIDRDHSFVTILYYFLKFVVFWVVCKLSRRFFYFQAGNNFVTKLKFRTQRDPKTRFGPETGSSCSVFDEKTSYSISFSQGIRFWWSRCPKPSWERSFGQKPILRANFRTCVEIVVFFVVCKLSGPFFLFLAGNNFQNKYAIQAKPLTPIRVCGVYCYIFVWKLLPAKKKKWPGQFTHNEKTTISTQVRKFARRMCFWPKLRSQLGFGHRDHQKRIPCEKLIL